MYAAPQNMSDVHESLWVRPATSLMIGSLIDLLGCIAGTMFVSRVTRKMGVCVYLVLASVGVTLFMVALHFSPVSPYKILDEDAGSRIQTSTFSRGGYTGLDDMEIVVPSSDMFGEGTSSWADFSHGGAVLQDATSFSSATAGKGNYRSANAGGGIRASFHALTNRMFGIRHLRELATEEEIHDEEPLFANQKTSQYDIQRAGLSMHGGPRPGGMYYFLQTAGMNDYGHVDSRSSFSTDAARRRITLVQKGQRMKRRFRKQGADKKNSRTKQTRIAVGLDQEPAAAPAPAPADAAAAAGAAESNTTFGGTVSQTVQSAGEAYQFARNLTAQEVVTPPPPTTNIDERPYHLEWMLQLGFIVSKFAVHLGFAVLYLFGPELYPTEVRACGAAVSMAIGRLGAICAPLGYEVCATINPLLFYIIILLLYLVSWLLLRSVPLKETAGHPLVEADSDAEIDKPVRGAIPWNFVKDGERPAVLPYSTKVDERGMVAVAAVGSAAVIGVVLGARRQRAKPEKGKAPLWKWKKKKKFWRKTKSLEIDVPVVRANITLDLESNVLEKEKESEALLLFHLGTTTTA
eukprot:g3287.t1